jgi:poly(A) polymerase Pap1
MKSWHLRLRHSLLLMPFAPMFGGEAIGQTEARCVCRSLYPNGSSSCAVQRFVELLSKIAAGHTLLGDDASG